MAAITEKELNALIKSGNISGAYYLYGTDLYLTEQYARAMIKQTVKQGDEAYNLHTFEGKNLDVEALSEACEAVPMFADRLCVAVRDLDLEAEKLSDPKRKLLFETAGNLPESTVLIFYTANADVFGGKKTVTPKNKRLIDLIEKKGCACRLMIKSRSEAVKSIISRAGKQGCAIEQRAAEILWERCLGDMNMIVNELDKLSAYVSGGVIDAVCVEKLTPETGDAKAYNLADAVAAGNMGKSMELYNDLINSRSDPIYLLYVLTGSMNDLYRARLAIDFNRSVTDVMRDFSYARNVEFRVKNAFASARKASLPRLRRCMEILADADMDMKSGAGTPAVIIEKAIVQMLSGTGRER